MTEKKPAAKDRIQAMLEEEGFTQGKDEKAFDVIERYMLSAQQDLTDMQKSRDDTESMRHALTQEIDSLTVEYKGLVDEHEALEKDHDSLGGDYEALNVARTTDLEELNKIKAELANAAPANAEEHLPHRAGMLIKIKALQKDLEKSAACNTDLVHKANELQKLADITSETDHPNQELIKLLNASLEGFEHARAFNVYCHQVRRVLDGMEDVK